MLFVLNTVSVLTLIDVPVCFPLLQTERTHTKRGGGLLQAWRSETKTTLCAAFCRPFVSKTFRLCSRSDRDDTKQRWTDEPRTTRGGRGSEWVTMCVGWQQRNEETFTNWIPQSIQSANWKFTCQQAAWCQMLAILYRNVYGDIKLLIPWGWMMIYLSPLNLIKNKFNFYLIAG